MIRSSSFGPPPARRRVRRVMPAAIAVTTAAAAGATLLAAGPAAEQSATPSVRSADPTSASAATDAPFSITATMPTDLTVGATRALKIDVTIGEGWSTGADRRRPGVMVQFDVPGAVTLAGRVIESPRELARNEFLEEPFERAIPVAGTTIDFTLDREPTAGETLGVNVVAYMQGPDGAGSRFVRRRVDLPLTGGATATADQPATASGWGRNGTLAIGQPAPAMTLSRADGTSVDLAELIGSKPIVVTTYRAFW